MTAWIGTVRVPIPEWTSDGDVARFTADLSRLSLPEDEADYSGMGLQ